MLYGVGVGPGDPELMTIKAVNIIKKADLIVFPSKNKGACYAYNIVRGIIPEIEDKKLQFCDFPMVRNDEEIRAAIDSIYRDIESYLAAGKSVVFPTIGDPCIYSTYFYIHERALKQGFEAEIINGITSFTAVAARLGISLGMKEQQLHIIPGNYEKDIDPYLKGTRVYMKYGRRLSELKSFLKSEATAHSVAAITNYGMENERIYKSLEEIPDSEDYLTVVIVY